jgi:hypothetical protein
MRIPKYLSPLWRVLVRYFRGYPPVVQSHGAGVLAKAAKQPQAAQCSAHALGAGFPLRGVSPRWYW